MSICKTSLHFFGQVFSEAGIQPDPKRPWQQELDRFLLQYRTAPHSTTGVPSSELLFNHTGKGKLPVLNKRNIVNKHKQAQQQQQQRP